MVLTNIAITYVDTIYVGAIDIVMDYAAMACAGMSSVVLAYSGMAPFSVYPKVHHIRPI